MDASKIITKERISPDPKIEPLDVEWHCGLSATLADEWNSPDDAEAFGEL